MFVARPAQHDATSVESTAAEGKTENVHQQHPLIGCAPREASMILLFVVAGVVVVTSAIWVGADHGYVKSEFGWNEIGHSAVGWAVGILVFWIVAFPLYLCQLLRPA
jgi:hypothetical protein